MDALKGFGYLSFGSRLKRLSDYMMRETQLVYNHYHLDFDPYLFPVYKIIANKNGVTNTELVNLLNFTQPAITQVINKLIKKELVILTNHDTDKRKKIIHLSKKGIVMHTKLQPIWRAIEKTIIDSNNHTSQSLLDHINYLEDLYKQEHFSEKI